MKILMHCCCGPCAVAPLQKLQEDGHRLIAYFYNPNIQPYREYRLRRNAWQELVKIKGLSSLIDDEYSLQEWLAAVAQNPAERCEYCYRLRLERAALVAQKKGCEAFTTSLLVSPYQNHEMLKALGQEIAAPKGLTFYYEDFRPLFRQGQQAARQLGLYMQKYCACIYSEQERYYKG
ncbi:MAG: epoxyqueuosine reductase QueH [Bacillota bacterium]